MNEYTNLRKSMYDKLKENKRFNKEYMENVVTPTMASAWENETTLIVGESNKIDYWKHQTLVSLMELHFIRAVLNDICILQTQEALKEQESKVRPMFLKGFNADDPVLSLMYIHYLSAIPSQLFNAIKRTGKKIKVSELEQEWFKLGNNAGISKAKMSRTTRRSYNTVSRIVN